MPRNINITLSDLTCNKHNTHSLDVYKKWGFEKVDEDVTDIGNGYVMDD